MCKMMEDMRKEVAVENARSMLNDNIPLEKVSKYSGLSLDEVEKLKQEMCS